MLRSHGWMRGERSANLLIFALGTGSIRSVQCLLSPAPAVFGDALFLGLTCRILGEREREEEGQSSHAVIVTAHSQLRTSHHHHQSKAHDSAPTNLDVPATTEPQAPPQTTRGRPTFEQGDAASSSSHLAPNMCNLAAANRKGNRSERKRKAVRTGGD